MLKQASGEDFGLEALDDKVYSDDTDNEHVPAKNGRGWKQVHLKNKQPVRQKLPSDCSDEGRGRQSQRPRQRQL